MRNARTTFGSELTEVNDSQWYDADVSYTQAQGLWPGTPAGSLKGVVKEGTAEVELTTGKTETLKVGDRVVITGISGNFTISAIKSTTVFTVAQDGEAVKWTKSQKEAAEGKVVITVTNPVGLIGDFSQAVVGVRQDIEYEIATQGVITDGQGRVTLNLFESDSVAMKVTARFAYAVANSVTYYQPEEAKRFPFAVLYA